MVSELVEVVDITVVIPAIPPRIEDGRYARALQSARDQSVIAAMDIITAVDCDHAGAAATRNRALDRVTTGWVAFLDDDDQYRRTHLWQLWRAAQATGADVVYPGCDVYLNGQPLPHEKHHDEWGRFGRSFDPAVLRDHSYIPVTSLVRTSLAQAARFGAPEGSSYDDWGFYLRLLDAGAEFYHVPIRTWIWHHQPGPGGNTSGQPDRW